MLSPDTQKRRSGLILSDRPATLWTAKTRWTHLAPSRSPKQALACRVKAPHRGAQSDVLAASTGRPEMAVRARRGIATLRAESVNCVAQEQSARWAIHPAPGTRRSHVSGATAWDGVPCNSWLRSAPPTHIDPAHPRGMSRPAPKTAGAPRWVRGRGVTERIARMEDDDELPTEIATGFLEFSGHRVRVVHLSDGRRIVPVEEVRRVLKLLGIDVQGATEAVVFSTGPKD